MTAILYVLRNGGEWSCLPKSLGAKSTMHDRFQEWNRAGIFEKIWTAALELLQYLEALDLEWQSMDGAMVKAPLGGKKIGRNPTDRGKLGVKRSLHVDGSAIPPVSAASPLGAGLAARMNRFRRFTSAT
jgi:putative transposase